MGSKSLIKYGLKIPRVYYDGTEEIVYEFSTGTSAVRWLEKHPGEIDLLFLDVEMDGLNGMDAAAAIRKFNQEILIVFVTGYSDYVFDGYKVNALDYIIKPAKSERLFEVLRRVRVHFDNKKNDMYLFKNTDGIFRIPLAQILYFYSDKRKAVLVCSQKTGIKEYSFYAKLDDVEKQLDQKFVRIHQRYLVNPQQTEQIGTDHVIVGGAWLPISRALKDEASNRLAKAMLL